LGLKPALILRHLRHNRSRALKRNKLSSFCELSVPEEKGGEGFPTKCGELAPAARALVGWQVGGLRRFHSSLIPARVGKAGRRLIQSPGYEDSWFPTHSAKDAEWMGHPDFVASRQSRWTTNTKQSTISPRRVFVWTKHSAIAHGVGTVSSASAERALSCPFWPMALTA